MSSHRSLVHKSLSVGVAVLVASVAIAACGGSSTTQHSASATTSSSAPLTVDMGQSPTTLDPHWATNLGEAGFSQSFYVQLTRYGTTGGPNGTLQSDPSHIELYFAKSMKITDGGRTYIFTLPSGATFSSGNPVDSRAVKYSFERDLKINGAGGFYLSDGYVSPPLITGIDAPNPQTVIIHLRVPDPNFPQALAQPGSSIVDPAAVEAHGGVVANQPNTWMTSHVAGSGPFLLKSYQPGVKAVLVANPRFFSTPPKAKEIDVNFISSDSTLLLQARNGNADITIGMTKQAAASLRGTSGLRVVANRSQSFEELGMVASKPPFTDVNVRRAVAYAIPYQQILSRVAYGFGSLSNGPYPPTVPGYNPSIEAPIPYNPAKARALLAAANFHGPVPVNLAVLDDNNLELQIATIVQGILQPYGFKVNIVKLSEVDDQNALVAKKYQMFILDDGPPIYDPGYQLSYDQVCHQQFNFTDMCSPAADKLLAQARVETNGARRQAMYNELAQTWVNYQPRVDLYSDSSVAVLGRNVGQYMYADEPNLYYWSH